MMNKEEYNHELIRMWDMQRGDEYKGKNICDGVFCEDCPLSEINNDGRDGCMEPMKVFEIIKIVEKWAKENPQKHKISKLEYDILKSYLDYKNHMTVDIADYFFEDGLLLSLLKKGYFQGATLGTDVKEYFKNCEVKEDV